MADCGSENRCRINSRNSLWGGGTGRGGQGLNRLQLAGWQPLFSNRREETCNRSDTGHYRTCPSSFVPSPPPLSRTEEGDRVERKRASPSNEEKQSLKPAVRPIGRGNAFYLAGYRAMLLRPAARNEFIARFTGVRTGHDIHDQFLLTPEPR